MTFDLLKRGSLKEKKGMRVFMDKIQELQKMIDESNKIVFFSGAGVSTDSGIKDFRSKDGIYSLKLKYSPEYMLSSEMFYKNTKEFYEFYKQTFNTLDIKPNVTHEYLKKLEDKGKLKAIVTQNIDGLHTKAGNKKVYEIHGTIHENYCLDCHKFFPANYVFNSKDIPKCDKCSGIIKPSVILYGEMLPNCYLDSINAINEADMLIVAGTSLTVEPASSLINYFHGKYLVIINNTKTPYDYKADLVIHDNLKKIFSKLI